MTVASVAAHYSQGNLLQRIYGALAEAGKDVDHLTVEDLAPVDHFHTLGVQATIGLAEAAGLSGGEEVLDVGSGLGGPARLLAAKYGCRVTGIDVTPEYCRVAEELNARVGLQDRIVIREADAVAMPFDDRSFDLVWTMHVTMNIEDKPTLYEQFARVLRPGGKLAFFDLIAGAGDVIFPVPWADHPSISYMVDEAALRVHLGRAGFHVRGWDDLTAEGAAFFATLAGSPLGPHLVLADMPPKMMNLRRNLEDRRVRAIRSICTLA